MKNYLCNAPTAHSNITVKPTNQSITSFVVIELEVGFNIFHKDG